MVSLYIILSEIRISMSYKFKMLLIHNYVWDITFHFKWWLFIIISFSIYKSNKLYHLWASDLSSHKIEDLFPEQRRKNDNVTLYIQMEIVLGLLQNILTTKVVLFNFFNCIDNYFDLQLLRFTTVSIYNYFKLWIFRLMTISIYIAFT